jgi:hypothetical protein
MALVSGGMAVWGAVTWQLDLLGVGAALFAVTVLGVMYDRYRRRRAFERLAQREVDEIVVTNTHAIRGAAWLGVGAGFAIALFGAYEARLVPTAVGLMLVATSFADLIILAPTRAPRQRAASDAAIERSRKAPL